jgi:hypothetical protein
MGMVAGDLNLPNRRRRRNYFKSPDLLQAARSEQMDGELSNDQIALLCDLERHDPSSLAAAEKHDLEQLVGAGYAEYAGERSSGPFFQLTAKGMDFLARRGAGLNES